MGFSKWHANSWSSNLHPDAKLGKRGGSRASYNKSRSFLVLVIWAPFILFTIINMAGATLKALYRFMSKQLTNLSHFLIDIQNDRISISAAIPVPLGLEDKYFIGTHHLLISYFSTNMYVRSIVIPSADPRSCYHLDLDELIGSLS